MTALPKAGLPVLLGLAAAITWGAADFCGGLAARRAAPSRVVLLAHGSSLVVLLALSLHLPKHLSVWAVTTGVLSGVIGGMALMLFYEGMALGAMGLSAAIAGLLTAVLPVLLALRSQGAPGAPQLAGFVMAAASIVLIAYAPAPSVDSQAGSSCTTMLGAPCAAQAGENGAFASGTGRNPGLLLPTAVPSRKALLFPVLAGLGFGLQLVWLHTSASGGSESTGAGASVHPFAPVLRALLLSRAGGTVAALAALLLARVRRVPPAATEPGCPVLSFVALALLAGLLDTSGNSLYVLSSLGGRLDVAAVLSSLYPGATIVLAALFLGERANGLQTLGMACALVAVMLIAL